MKPVQYMCKCMHVNTFSKCRCNSLTTCICILCAVTAFALPLWMFYKQSWTTLLNCGIPTSYGVGEVALVVYLKSYTTFLLCMVNNVVFDS